MTNFALADGMKIPYEFSTADKNDRQFSNDYLTVTIAKKGHNLYFNLSETFFGFCSHDSIPVKVNSPHPTPGSRFSVYGKVSDKAHTLVHVTTRSPSIERESFRFA